MTDIQVSIYLLWRLDFYFLLELLSLIHFKNSVLVELLERTLYLFGDYQSHLYESCWEQERNTSISRHYPSYLKCLQREKYL